MRATPRGLYVAAGEGLFVSTDGRKFRREVRVRERGANRLALSRGRLFVTTPAALYKCVSKGATWSVAGASRPDRRRCKGWQ